MVVSAEKVSKVREEYVSNGHQFGENMTCIYCGRMYEKHQQIPHPCPGAIKNLWRTVSALESLVTRRINDIKDRIGELESLSSNIRES